MYAIGGGNAVIADTELNCNGLTVSNTAHLVVSNSIVSYGSSSFQTFGGSRTTFVGGKISGTGAWYPGNRVEKEAVTVLDGVITDFNEVTAGYYNNKNFYGKSRIVITNDAEVSMEKLSGRHGSIHQYGGVVKVTGKATGDFRIGSQSNGNFEYCIYGGSLLQTGYGTDRGFHIGMHENFTPDAYLRLYGGEAVMSQPIGYLGRYAKNVGNIYAHGGLFKMKHASGRLYVGYLGSGRLSVSDGGVVDIPTEIGVLPKSATVGRKGYVDLLTNGTVTAQRIYSTCTNDTAELTFDGGAFVAKAGARTPLISGFTAAFVGVGGGTVDTAGQDLTVEQNFAARAGQTWTVGDGGDALLTAPAFTKKGEGVLTLVGTNTYACATCVSNGTLIAACEGALPETTTLRLGSGGIVDLGGEVHTVANVIGSGTIRNGTLNVTGWVYPGYGDNGELSVASDAALNLKKLGYKVDDSGACGVLKVAGSIDLSGVGVSVDLTEVPARGLRLVDAASISGSPVKLSGKYALSVRGGSLRMGVPPLIITIR
jgi:autotransporter-associated beta strand protein/T5SS/PEP-CTERM-associated repeat protein